MNLALSFHNNKEKGFPVPVGFLLAWVLLLCAVFST